MVATESLDKVRTLWKDTLASGQGITDSISCKVPEWSWAVEAPLLKDRAIFAFPSLSLLK